MKPSNNMNSYEFWMKVVEEWIDDIDDLKVDIRQTVMDWFESYVLPLGECDNRMKELADKDNTDENWVWSSMEDALNDWLDEHLFK